MEDEEAIIYIALSNSINMLQSSLEEDELDELDKDLTQYLITRHLELLDKYEKSIDKDNTIKRPQWNQKQNP